MEASGEDEDGTEDRSGDDSESCNTLDVGGLDIILEFDGSCRNWCRVQLSLEALNCWHPAHGVCIRTVINIVVPVDRVTEHPEVLCAWQEVDEAQGVVLSLTNIGQQIASSDLNPMTTSHDPNIIQWVTAIGIENAVVFIGIFVAKEALEEGG